MRRVFVCLCAALPLLPSEALAEPCRTISGRAHAYSDGGLRIFQLGTHRVFKPDDSSRLILQQWIEAGVNPTEDGLAIPAANIDLHGTFLLCPVAAYRPGFATEAKIVRVTHRRYVHSPR